MGFSYSFKTTLNWEWNTFGIGVGYVEKKIMFQLGFLTIIFE